MIKCMKRLLTDISGGSKISIMHILGKILICQSRIKIEKSSNKFLESILKIVANIFVIKKN